MAIDTDTEDPTAICPTNMPSVVLDANGNGTLAANALAGGNSTDNCSAIETSPMTTFTCADAPSASVVLTAMDAAGNSTTANCIVTISDCPSIEELPLSNPLRMVVLGLLLLLLSSRAIIQMFN